MIESSWLMCIFESERRSAPTGREEAGAHRSAPNMDNHRVFTNI